MTDKQHDEEVSAITRLAVTFSTCPSNRNGGHTWNLDTGTCDLCGIAWPYHDEDGMIDGRDHNDMPGRVG